MLFSARNLSKVFRLLLGFFFIFFINFNLVASEEIAIAPEYVQDYSAGMEAFKRKDYTKAIEFFAQALNKNPDYPDALCGLGTVYFAMAKEDLERAGRHFRRALIINPNHYETLEIEGQYYLMTGKITKAYKNYQTLLKICDIEADDLKALLDPVLKEAQEVLQQYTLPKTPAKK